ncbi:MAG TPA: maleylpyruvate isomerase family mycothiol-dependent enzyme, partial [Acidimicrobiales bacterium]|nr:maleylpyruvate isomerase family mycothiol-dependent enzyme [Acidimicrobiales bacterium]
ACPEWDLAKLGLHLGLVYTWAGEQVRQRLTEPLDRSTLPRAPEGNARIPWFLEAAARAVEGLRAAESDAPAGGWRDQTVTAGFWRRRLAHETAVHHLDAEEAVGRAGALDAELASDGIDEVLDVFLPYARAGAGGWPPPGALHLVRSDGDGAWTLEPGPADVVVHRTTSVSPARRTDAGATVTAPALALQRLCWGRSEPRPEQLSGDPGLARRWLAGFRW